MHEEYSLWTQKTINFHSLKLFSTKTTEMWRQITYCLDLKASKGIFMAAGFRFSRMLHFQETRFSCVCLKSVKQVKNIHSCGDVGLLLHSWRVRTYTWQELYPTLTFALDPHRQQQLSHEGDTPLITRSSHHYPPPLPPCWDAKENLPQRKANPQRGC